ncbi:MAG: methylmalonyl-CoA epimerase [Pseudomonadota bacterium]
MTEFTLGRLNHVGVAIPDIEEAMETYRSLYGVSAISTPFDIPAQGVKVCFVDVPNTQIELIEPLSEESPIWNFIQKNPKGGQHHVCYEVDDIHQAVEVMQDRGATVLGEPRIGAHGTPIVFIHPKNSNGVLVELMESPKEGAH